MILFSLIKFTHILKGNLKVLKVLLHLLYVHTVVEEFVVISHCKQ